MIQIVDSVTLEKPLSIWLPVEREVDPDTGLAKPDWEHAVEYRVKIQNAKTHAELVKTLKDLKNYVQTSSQWCDPIGRNYKIYTGDGYYEFKSEEDQNDGRDYWYAEFYKSKYPQVFQLLTGAAAYRSIYYDQNNQFFDLSKIVNQDVPKWEYGKPHILPCLEDFKRIKHLEGIFETGCLPLSEVKFILETCYPQFAMFSTDVMDCITLDPVREVKYDGYWPEVIERNQQTYTLAKRMNRISHSLK